MNKPAMVLRYRHDAKCMINKPQVYVQIAPLGVGCWVLFLHEFIFGITKDELLCYQKITMLMQLAFLV